MRLVLWSLFLVLMSCDDRNANNVSDAVDGKKDLGQRSLVKSGEYVIEAPDRLIIEAGANQAVVEISIWRDDGKPFGLEQNNITDPSYELESKVASLGSAGRIPFPPKDQVIPMLKKVNVVKFTMDFEVSLSKEELLDSSISLAASLRVFTNNSGWEDLSFPIVFKSNVPN